MKITRLSAQKRTGRVNVYLDGEFWLGLSSEAVVRLGLYQGQELSPVEREEAEAGSDRERYFDRAVHFLSYRPRSEQEVRGKLSGLGASEEEVAQTLERLRGIGLIDDRSFAELYLKDRDAVRPTGRDRLRVELRRRGVALELIDEVLDGRPAEDELEQLRALAQRDRLWGERDDPATRQRLYGKLRRRGYSGSLITRVIGED